MTIICEECGEEHETINQWLVCKHPSLEIETLDYVRRGGRVTGSIELFIIFFPISLAGLFFFSEYLREVILCQIGLSMLYIGSLLFKK
jgi:hypothetical protein